VITPSDGSSERKNVPIEGAVTITLPFFRPTPESLVKRLQDLPPAPKILHTLRRLIERENTTLGMIADVITLEPGLSARVVRMANSTHFGGRTPVESITEAIQRVGLVGVQELVTFAVASQLVGRPLASYQISAQNLWFRAVACALAASGLAEQSDVDRNDAYTAGLMHGLGLLVIDRHASQQRRLHLFPSSGYPLDFAPAERAWLGFSHAEAGGALLELWGFPEPVITAVRYQLEPEASGPHRRLGMVLATARWARSLFCVPEELIPDLPAPEWLEESGVEIADFGDWLKLLRVRYTIECEELRLG
jgi:HD-like signal output (HDOD) protein